MLVHVIEGYFGFENGTFTCVSGSSTPALFRFTKNDAQEFLLKRYEKLMPGPGYASLNSIFGDQASHKLDTLQIDALYPQLEACGKAYLSRIGREAAVQWNRAETVSPTIESTTVSNALLEE